MVGDRITIAGGGLAGLSLAIGLRHRGIPVRLIEAGRYPRHRVCGEFISGISEKSLKHLGIPDIFEGALRHRTSAWFFRDDEVLRACLPREAIGVSRFKLDHDLARRFERMGGELVTGRRFREDPAPGVIFATGRRRSRVSSWIGIKCHLRGYEMDSDLEMHLGEGAYVGTSGVEDGKVDACGLFRLRPGIRAPREQLLVTYLEACGLRSMAERVRRSRIDLASCLGVNAFDLGWQPKGETTPKAPSLSIGDHLAIIPPFSGNGMSMAFEGAAAAIDPVVAYANGQASWEETCRAVDRDLSKRFRTRLAVSRTLHPFLTEPGKQRLLVAAGRAKLVPYATLFRMLR